MTVGLLASWLACDRAMRYSFADQRPAFDVQTIAGSYAAKAEGAFLNDDFRFVTESRRSHAVPHSSHREGIQRAPGQVSVNLRSVNSRHIADNWSCWTPSPQRQG